MGILPVHLFLPEKTGGHEEEDMDFKNKEAEAVELSMIRHAISQGNFARDIHVGMIHFKNASFIFGKDIHGSHQFFITNVVELGDLCACLIARKLTFVCQFLNTEAEFTDIMEKAKATP